MFMYFDPMYLLFMAPALVLAGIASAKTKGTFNKYSRVAASSRLTGAQAARRMLDRNGLQDVKIHRARGFLSDHYNPANRSLNLSARRTRFAVALLDWRSVSSWSRITTC